MALVARLVFRALVECNSFLFFKHLRRRRRRSSSSAIVVVVVVVVDVVVVVVVVVDRCRRPSLSSIVAFVASVVSIAMTSYGVHLREARLQRRLMPTLSNDNFDAGSEAGVGAVTINLFVTTILEFFLSILSIRVAFKGYRQR